MPHLESGPSGALVPASGDDHDFAFMADDNKVGTFVVFLVVF